MAKHPFQINRDRNPIKKILNNNELRMDYTQLVLSYSVR